jgi:hypothetical protein
MLKTVYIWNQIINTEWGGFSKILPQTIFDLEMDETSLNPGEHVVKFYPFFSNIMFFAWCHMFYNCLLFVCG